ncbi:hypothetical protein OSB04_026987 [Centaurea solstitialis]|uniref:Protein kinase domain-containing protein n=1 Tax=Centaurea solstitialis TaxID=347529 RepID=A0AA38SR65_9ASTR|nr:hypothetical protein OSB04_026987 [Centaurea solstitialis]
MEGENPSQRVVLIHDASGGVRTTAVRWIIDGFSLKSGDVFTFLFVLCEIHHPMGYKIKVDGSMFGGNQKAINQEIARRKKEYQENLDLIEISKLYETKKIDLKIELVAGPIPKNAAVEAAKKYNPTWVILDRRMKRDKNHFLQKLSCGISTMKRNDDIIKIRGPKVPRNPDAGLSYKQMLPMDHKKPTQSEDDLFSIDFDSSYTSSTSTSTSFSDSLTLANSQDENIKLLSMLLEGFGEERVDSLGEITNDQVQILAPEEKVQLDQKKCTTCSSTRPTSVWESREFSYSELVDATNRFSSDNLIYRGENEAVFHGTLKGSKLDVIVKEQKDVKKYKSEMQALEKTRNENVVMLLGSCLENSPRLLVFEFACNGSLDQHLSHQRSRPLTWTERIKIAVGASRGLFHLHENDIIHSDMRPKNILLTHDFDPLIAGFGLARMKNEPDNSSDHYIIGTYGYLAPEYTKGAKATNKTDVYAFGMVLLELLTGWSPTDTRLKGQSLVNWVISLVKENKLCELIDPGIAYHEDQLMSMVQVAVGCVCEDSDKRLAMDEVTFTLDFIKDSHDSDQIQEVNNQGSNGQSHDGEKVNFNFAVTTPVPKQAKHYYQDGQV